MGGFIRVYLLLYLPTGELEQKHRSVEILDAMTKTGRYAFVLKLLYSR